MRARRRLRHAMRRTMEWMGSVHRQVGMAHHVRWHSVRKPMWHVTHRWHACLARVKARYIDWSGVRLRPQHLLGQWRMHVIWDAMRRRRSKWTMPLWPTLWTAAVRSRHRRMPLRVLWLRGHVQLLPGVAGGSRHNRNTKFPQSTALVHAGDGLLSRFPSKDPIFCAKVFDIPLHFDVLLTLIVFSQVPGSVKGP
ncbi:hypothetical protein KC350_g71 [Hortaea werneckii]|nr:hypothetical protein KC350_g71 [Hortaea werneckii]